MYILLHGALGAAAQMQGLSEKLSIDNQVLTCEFSGHGGKALPQGGFSIMGFADELSVFLQEHNIADATLFGYSMGGYVALELARRDASRIRRIITLGTKFDWTPESAAQEAAMLNPEKMEAKIPQFAEMLRQRHAPQDWKAVVKATADMMLDLGNGSAFSYAGLRSVAVPVQIMVGELDNMVTQAEGQNAAANLPHGTFVCLPRTKHPFEQVDLGLLLDSFA